MSAKISSGFAGREPRSRLAAVIVGTGFSGLGMAIRLKQQGVEDFVILEQSSDVGGTWRDNHYPGAACDVQSHLYSFSFEPNPRWSREFAPQAEILDYLRNCARKYDVLRHIRFQTPATGARFDAQRGVWTVHSDSGDLEARSVVSAVGGLSRPQFPEIDGLDSFQGKLMHSARWDHDYPLTGKRVGVIGTGASAIQVVPGIVDEVGSLALFQRTPAWVLPKPDRAIGWLEQALYRHLPAVQRAQRYKQYVTLEPRALGFVVSPSLMRHVKRVGIAHIQREVRDPDLQRRLTPEYMPGCKRILMSNDFYPALNREHVQLVTDGIERVDASGIWTRDGRHHELDAIVLCTGFEAAEALAPFPVLGVNGQDLNHAWRDGAEAYLGTCVSGFPNLFLLMGPNVGLGHSSMVLMLESQIAHAAQLMQRMRVEELAWIDVYPQAQAAYNRELQGRLGRSIWASGCQSWYQTRTGKNTTLWPGFTFEFMYRSRRLHWQDYHFEPLELHLGAERGALVTQRSDGRRATASA